MRVLRIAGAALALTGLTGCGVPVAVSVASYAADGASFLSTGRSMTDHGISILLQEDCALFRAVKAKPVCQPMNKDDLVYDVAFAHRTYNYPDPDAPETLRTPVPAPSPPAGAVQLASAAPALPVQAVWEPPAVQQPAASAEILDPETVAPALPDMASAAAEQPRPRPAASVALQPSRPAGSGFAVARVPLPRPAVAPAIPPVMPNVVPRLRPGYHVVAGAFQQRANAETRRKAVMSQLARLGQTDLPVNIVRLPKGGSAVYVVLTQSVDRPRADVLTARLALDRGETPWTFRSGHGAL